MERLTLIPRAGRYAGISFECEVDALPVDVGTRDFPHTEYDPQIGSVIAESIMSSPLDLSGPEPASKEAQGIMDDLIENLGAAAVEHPHWRDICDRRRQK